MAGSEVKANHYQEKSRLGQLCLDHPLDTHPWLKLLFLFLLHHPVTFSLEMHGDDQAVALLKEGES